MASITAGVEPKFFRDAVAEKVWRDAMRVEVDALEINKTWDLTHLPPGKHVIGISN